MAMYGLFGDLRPGENLDVFHQRCVVPDPSEAACRNADVDEFVRFLHSQFNERPYTVAEVVKGGSLGKGTAVRGTADIDLVVFVNGLTSIQDLEAHRQRLLNKLEDKVKRHGRWRGRVQFDGRTQFALKYKLDGQELDILPAVNILGTTGSLAQLYWGMSVFPGGNIHAGQQYSASLVPLQIDFVKRQGEEVKRVIRLVKMWKKERGLSIRSYTLELITIKAARGGGWSNTEQLLRKVMGMLQNCGNLVVAFDDIYQSSNFARGWTVPYVMDPANPYMNTLYNVVRNRDTAQISREAISACRVL